MQGVALLLPLNPRDRRLAVCDGETHFDSRRIRRDVFGRRRVKPNLYCVGVVGVVMRGECCEGVIMAAGRGGQINTGEDFVQGRLVAVLDADGVAFSDDAKRHLPIHTANRHGVKYGQPWRQVAG